MQAYLRTKEQLFWGKIQFPDSSCTMGCTNLLAPQLVLSIMILGVVIPLQAAQIKRSYTQDGLREIEAEQLNIVSEGMRVMDQVALDSFCTEAQLYRECLNSLVSHIHCLQEQWSDLY